MKVVGLANQSITKVAGQILHISTTKDVPVVPCLDPGYISKNNHLLKKFAEDLYTAYQVGYGIDKLDQSNQVVMVTDALQLMDLIDNIKKSRYASFDFETTKLTDLKTYDPDFYLTMLAFTFQQGSSYVIPLYHQDSPNSKEFIETCRVQLEQEVFLNPDVTKIGQNVKFDMHCLNWWGIEKVLGPIHDTMTAHHLLNEHGKHGLKVMIQEFNPRYANYESKLGDYKWHEIPIDILVKYAALDSDLTFRLYWKFTELLLDEDERLYILYRNLICASTPALFAMEQRGMLIDKKYLLESIEKVTDLINETESEMYDAPAVLRYRTNKEENAQVTYIEGLEEKVKKKQEKEFKTAKAQENNEAAIVELKRIIVAFDEDNIFPHEVLKDDVIDVNFASSSQMKELLYNPVGFNFPPPKDQWGRSMESTGKDVLDLLKDKTGFVNNLLALRQLKLIRSTYLQGILNRLDSKHLIHSTFNQNGTGTGRLSASNPNLQNVITRTKYKKVEEAAAMVKKCFIPPKGMEIMQADFSQAELRLIAHYAQDETMLEAYNNGEDLHALTAATTMGLSLEEFKNLPDKDRKRYRYEAKSTNFGFIYVMSAEGFKDYARTNYGIEISIKQARDRREKFFKKYPKLLKYHKTYIAKAKKYGYVRTLFGQKLRLPDIYSNISQKQGHAERNAINGPIQGTAGQMMIFVLALLYHRAPWLYLVNSIHDSALPYVQELLRQAAIDIMRETMEHLPMEEYFGRTVDSVSMKVDFEISASSWGELQEI